MKGIKVRFQDSGVGQVRIFPPALQEQEAKTKLRLLAWEAGVFGSDEGRRWKFCKSEYSLSSLAWMWRV